jgi:hypothetical protein
MTSSIFQFPTPLDCDAVDARLADYLDDEPPTALTDADRAAVDRHVASCARCRALVRDLRGLADAAETLPALVPSRDLWSGIAPRLASRAPAGAPGDQAAHDGPARVLPFEVRHLRHAPPPSRLRGSAPVTWSRRWLAAAAVALMAVSAGGTYLLTRPDTSTGAPSQLAVAPGPDAAAADDRPPVDAPLADPASERPGPGEASRPDGPTPGARSAPRPRLGTNDGGAARLVARRDAPRDVAATVPAAAAYDREIAALRAVVRERSGDLDSTTVNVLVRNLGIIDAAIAQSREALARDPHSQFLGEQLTRALGHKVELLRTVALMPRT